MQQTDCLLCGRPLTGKSAYDDISFLCDGHGDTLFTSGGPYPPYAGEGARLARLKLALVGRRITQLRFTTGIQFALVLDLDDGCFLLIHEGDDEVWASLTLFAAGLVATRDVRGFVVLDELNARFVEGPFDSKNHPKSNLDMLLREARSQTPIVGVNLWPCQLDFETVSFQFSGAGARVNQALLPPDERTDFWVSLEHRKLRPNDG